MSVSVSGAAADAVARQVPELVADRVASRLGDGDATLWGNAAEAEASIRLGWVHASSVSRPLVADIIALRNEFIARGLTRVVLCGMGGSSLAPEVITRTAGVPLVVLDSTHPTQVSRVVDTDIEGTVVVVSSKSGSTAETDSQKRAFEAAFVAAGIDPTTRIVIVTDPGSPLDQASRETGYRVFNADPTVGGRYSALTAFGLVPSGLAGVDIAELLDQADEALSENLADSESNPGLILGAAMAGTSPRRDKIAILSEESSIVGIGDWIEQLVAESTGKDNTGVLPVVLEAGAPDLSAADVLPIHIRDTDAASTGDSVTVAAPLGAQLLIWEIATAVAGRILGINPFDQPDVESAKIAARAFLDGTPEAAVPFAVDGSVELTAVGYEPTTTTVSAAVRELLATLPEDGYLSIHAYADREAGSGLESIRTPLAHAGGRPTTFGWAPRFLHSTGQYHKGGTAHGVFLQIVERAALDREVPGRPFTFGTLIAAQARGDAQVLADHHRPVLTLTVNGPTELAQVISVIKGLVTQPNPLRDPNDRRLGRIAGPSGLVIFGVTGDLSRKKLIPAVYDLANRGLLPPGFGLVGFARREWTTEEFIAVVHDSVKEFARTPFREDVWRQLSAGIRFVSGDFDDNDAFDRLGETIKELDAERGTMGNHAFYLSIPPRSFPLVTEQLRRSGLATPTDNEWRRVVIEKPFGSNLETARELNAVVESVFPPDSVFRIDHYLGKETVQNILALRFANMFYEPLWNANYVDHVQITMAEDVGVGGRAGYYDGIGAARDVIQNHLLQLLALTAMEEPVSFDAADLRAEKEKVLSAVKLPDDLSLATARGQYSSGWQGGVQVPGFLEEDGMNPNSVTETYAAMRLDIDTRRWAGVPFYLRAGKRLGRRVTEIAVVFKRAPQYLFEPGQVSSLSENALVIRVQPDEGVTVRFGSKVPGAGMQVRDVTMDFGYGHAFTEESPEAYERLILDVLLGDPPLFPRHEEVELSWQILDPIEEFWAANGRPEPYAPGSWGPASADEMLRRDGREWRRP